LYVCASVDIEIKKFDDMHGAKIKKISMVENSQCCLKVEVKES